MSSVVITSNWASEMYVVLIDPSLIPTTAVRDDHNCFAMYTV